MVDTMAEVERAMAVALPWPSRHSALVANNSSSGIMEVVFMAAPLPT